MATIPHCQMRGDGRWSCCGRCARALLNEGQGSGRSDLQLFAQPGVVRWSGVDSMGASALVHEYGQYEDCLQLSAVEMDQPWCHRNSIDAGQVNNLFHPGSVFIRGSQRYELLSQSDTFATQSDRKR